MRILSRTSLASPSIATTDLREHLRIDLDDHFIDAWRISEGARRDLEQHAHLAFFSTTVTAISQPEPGDEIALPIGPLLGSENVIVYTVAEDGTETEVTPAVIIEGQHPEIILSTAPAWRVKVSYRAGFGTTYEDLPEDLRLAWVEQAARVFDNRGDVDAHPGLAPAAARITSRFSRVGFA